jgi:hypothetical protein
MHDKEQAYAEMNIVNKEQIMEIGGLYAPHHLHDEGEWKCRNMCLKK